MTKFQIKQLNKSWIQQQQWERTYLHETLIVNNVESVHEKLEYISFIYIWYEIASTYILIHSQPKKI